MPELDQQLRAIIDASVPPLGLDEVRTRPGAARRSRWPVPTAVAIVTAAALVAAVAVIGRDAAQRTKVTTSPTTSPTPAAGWHQIAPGPLSPRSEAITAWTGSAFLVWGGQPQSGTTTDGAIYSPATDTWKPMARSPLTNTTGHFGVWDGTELLVWGQDWTGRTAGGNGAAYDPATDTWRPIAPNTIPAGTNLPVAVWDGHEVVLWTASRPDGTTRPVTTYQAAYDPATDAWRALPAGPLDVTNGVGAWDGTEALIVGWMYNAPNGVFPTGGKHSAAAYNPSTNTWRNMPALPWDQTEPASALTTAWTGTQLVAYTYSLHSARYSPTTNTWQALADLTLAAGECSPSSASVNGDVLASYCGQMAVYDSADSRWTTLASPVGAPPSLPVVAAGPSYLFWGAAPGTAPSPTTPTQTVAWLYTPASPLAPALGGPDCRPPSPITTAGTPEVHGTPEGATSLWGLVFGNIPLMVGEQVKFVWRMTGTGPLHVAPIAPDGSLRPLLSGPTRHPASSYQRPGDEWDTGITFDTPGCWTVRLTRTRGTATVYLDVYK
jgi:hypothetical protein